MVQLDKFIEEALLGIINGVKNARSKASSCKVAPRIHRTTLTLDPLSGEQKTEQEEVLQHVEFDIAVSINESTTSETQTSGSAKLESKGIIKVLAADISGEGGFERTKEHEQSTSRVSRLKFSVPICFDSHDVLMIDTHVRRESYEPSAAKQG